MATWSGYLKQKKKKDKKEKVKPKKAAPKKKKRVQPKGGTRFLSSFASR
tara:strand:- start:242 stop:388 length:147 start_codon:yes stop_codon:yes gene_type:complete